MTQSSYQFDLIEAAGFGYRCVWDERAYLFRLALIPVLLKLVCTLVIFHFNFENDFLKQGLIMLPASLAEGWLLAQFLRTLLMQERWPITLPINPTQEQMDKIYRRAKGIVACCLVYVLISLCAYAAKFAYFEVDKSAAQLLQVGAEVTQNAVATEPLKGVAPSGGENPLLESFKFIPAILAMVLGIWAFRLLWLYIPFSVLMNPMSFLRHLGGFMASVRLLGLFMITMIPLLLTGIFISRLLISPFLEGTGDGAELQPFGEFIMIFISVLTEIVTVLVSTAAVAFSMRAFLPKKAQALELKPQDDL
jgi:hypothetical protein